MGDLVIVVLLSSEVGPVIRTGAVVGISVLVLVEDGLLTTGTATVGVATGMSTSSHVPGVNVEPFTTSFRAKY